MQLESCHQTHNYEQMEVETRMMIVVMRVIHDDDRLNFNFHHHGFSFKKLWQYTQRAQFFSSIFGNNEFNTWTKASIVTSYERNSSGPSAKSWGMPNCTSVTSVTPWYEVYQVLSVRYYFYTLQSHPRYFNPMLKPFEKNATLNAIHLGVQHVNSPGIIHWPMACNRVAIYIAHNHQLCYCFCWCCQILWWLRIMHISNISIKKWGNNLH
jgi:hypothetical protein